MPIQCPTCFRFNPPNASYCYYDGRGLHEAALKGPLGLGTRPFPLPFSFSDGYGCSNFNQLVLACDQRWNEARSYLANGTWKTFFGTIGRTDLAALAVLAAKESDLDVGLCRLLERLPADAEALRPPKLALTSTEEDLGALEPRMDYKIELAIVNEGMLLLRGSIVTDCDWLAFGDRQGFISTKLFQTRDTFGLPVRILGSKLRAGKTPLEGQIVIDSNGGRQTVAVRATVPVRPFPKGQAANDVLAGATSPREIALKAKAHPQEAAVLFEQGAVKAWYESNGWTFPIRGTQAKGKSAVQQFFEALGLSKPPHLEINTQRIVCQGRVGQRLTKKVIVHTTEAKFVHAEAHSNQDWVKVLPATPQGKSITLPICIEIPPRPGETLDAIVTFLGNGQQRFVIPVALTVSTQTAEQEEKAARRASRRQWIAAAAVVFLGLVIALAVVIRHRLSQSENPSSDGTEIVQAPAEPKIDRWWDDIPRTNLTASVTKLKKDAGEENRPIFERIEGKVEDDRRDGYGQLAEKLPELARKPEIRQPLGFFVAECCVYEPSDSNLEPLLLRLTRQIPEEDSPLHNEEEVERAVFCLRIVCDAIALAHKADRPDRSQSLASELGKVFGLGFDLRSPAKQLQDRAEKVFAQRCYHNLLPTAKLTAIEETLALRKVLLDLLLRHLPLEFRGPEDMKLLRELERRHASALAAVGIVEGWTGENSSSVRKELVKMLESRLPMLKPEQMKKLRPLFLHKDIRIVLAGLNFVRDRKEEAADAAADVAELLKHNALEVRAAALNALLAMGPAVGALPDLSRQILDRRPQEKDPAIRQDLLKLLLARLRLLEPEQLKKLLPLLSHPDTDIVLVGLKVIEGRKSEAAELAVAVADLLEKGDAKVRTAALNALLATGPAVETELPDLLQRVQRLLRDKNKDIVVVGLKIVQARREKAAGLTTKVVSLLTDDDARVQAAALTALHALGSVAVKAGPRLSELLERRRLTKNADIAQALDNLLRSRLAVLKREQLKEELRPLLRDKDAAIALVGLDAVQNRKEQAADVADDVADLLTKGDAQLHQEALNALKALGPAAARALPKLFRILPKMQKSQRTPLALVVADLIEANDATNVKGIVPYLLEGLDPRRLKTGGKDAEAAINRSLLKFGQLAVDGSFNALTANLAAEHPGHKTNTDYRKKLYETLAKLGSKCAKKENHESLRRLWSKESNIRGNDEVTEAAFEALKRMDPG